MLYPCDTCYHKLVCKHCDEMKDFIKELDSAVQSIINKHPSLNTVNVIKSMERICTRYSAGINFRSTVASDEFGTFRAPFKEDTDKLFL